MPSPPDMGETIVKGGCLGGCLVYLALTLVIFVVGTLLGQPLLLSPGSFVVLAVVCLIVYGIIHAGQRPNPSSQKPNLNSSQHEDQEGSSEKNDPPSH